MARCAAMLYTIKLACGFEEYLRHLFVLSAMVM